MAFMHPNQIQEQANRPTIMAQKLFEDNATYFVDKSPRKVEVEGVTFTAIWNQNKNHYGRAFMGNTDPLDWIEQIEWTENHPPANLDRGCWGIEWPE